jgi:hypothetical protein
MRKLIISFGGVLHIKGVGHVGPTWAEPPGGSRAATAQQGDADGRPLRGRR